MELKRFEVDGGTLAVEVAGSGPLVICAAGMGDTRDSYSEVANQLVAKGYCVASMDTRGHGDSSAKFNRYGDEATADDFLMIVEKLNLGPAVLAGCSFAAAAAVIAAGRRPEAVAGIVLLGPFLRNGMGGVIGLWILPLFFLRPYGPWMWQTYAATLWPGLGDKAKERAKSSRTSLTRPDRWSAFQAVVSSLDHRQAAPWIDQVQAPVLVLMVSTRELFPSGYHGCYS